MTPTNVRAPHLGICLAGHPPMGRSWQTEESLGFEIETRSIDSCFPNNSSAQRSIATSLNSKRSDNCVLIDSLCTGLDEIYHSGHWGHMADITAVHKMVTFLPKLFNGLAVASNTMGRLGEGGLVGAGDMPYWRVC